MIIDYIELENFISHTNTRMNFSGGINVILGNNGAGKSSLMDGIRFALFGDSGRGNNSDLIHHGQGTSSVLLRFHVNDDSYEITRKISITKGEDSKTDAEMRHNDEVYATGAKSVNAAVESLFRISKELFFNSIFVKQGEIDQLVSEKPADRKRLFSQIIGIDELQKKAETIKALERRIRSGGESFIVHPEDLSGKREELALKKSGYEKLSGDIEMLTKEHEAARTELKLLREKVESEREQLIGLRQKSESLKAKKLEISGLEEKTRELHAKKESFSEAEAEFRKIETDRVFQSRDLIRSIDADMKEAGFITAQLRDLAKRLQEIKKLKERRESLKEQRDQYEKYRRKLDETEKIIIEQKSFMAEFSGTVQELERKRKQVQGMEENIERVRSSIPEEYRNLGKRGISEALSELNTRKSELSSKKGSVEARIEHMKAEIVETEGKMRMLGGQNTCPVCGTELTGEHMQRVVDDYREHIKGLGNDESYARESMRAIQTETAEIQKRIQMLNSRPIADYSEMKDTLETQKKELEALEASLKPGREKYELVRGYEKEIETLKEKIRELEGIYSEYSRVEAGLAALEADSSVQRIEELKRMREPLEERFRNGLDRAGLAEEKIPEAIERIRSMEKRLQELRPSMESSEKLNDALKEAELGLRNARSEAEKLEVSAKGLTETESRFRELSSRCDVSEKSAGEIRSRIDSLSGTMQHMKEDIEYREKEIGKVEARMKRYEAIQSAIRSLGGIRAALEKDGIQKYLRRESSEAITGKTRSLVSEFGLEIDDIRVSEDFDVEVSVSGAVESLSSLSGGEKTALAIALRLSVADYVLSRVSTFIMDEPTTFLDEDRRGQLKNILQNSLRDQSVLPQLIVITHHQELTKAADMVYLVHKHEGSSMVEPVD